MKIKDVMKRTLRWIFRGIPKINVVVDVGMIDRGSCLKNKIVIITGGGRGIGFSIAKRCISEGAKVIITGRNEETLKEASQQLGGCLFEILDVSKTDSIREFIEKIFRKFGHIDCLVNNAGVSFHENNILCVSEEGFREQFDTNLKGAYFMAKEFIFHNKSNCEILFVSSERGMQCDDVPYGLSKAALNSLTKGLSRRFYKDEIRVNAIAPGITTTNMTGRKANENMYCEGISSKRFFIPEEVAEVAVFLLSDASKCISGEVINCDAGNYISSYY